MKVTLNKVSGEIVEIRRSLPNIGLGPSTATVDHEFVADPLPVVNPDYKFDFGGNVFFSGRKVKIYKVFVRDSHGWSYVNTFSVPFRTPKKDLLKCYSEFCG